MGIDLTDASRYPNPRAAIARIARIRGRFILKMKNVTFLTLPKGLTFNKLIDLAKNCFEDSGITLNLSRLKAKDSRFIAPSNEGSSTGF